MTNLKPIYARVTSGEHKGKAVTILSTENGRATCAFYIPESEVKEKFPNLTAIGATLNPSERLIIDVEELQRLTFGAKNDPRPDCFLSRAIALAAEKHAGQFDQGGQPYILHPLRIMASVDTLEEKIVAVLHDVVEDTDVTLEQLREMGFPEEIVEGVASVTHDKKNENYFYYVRRAKQNKIGAKVKAADLRDNLAVNRLTLDGRDEERHLRYIKALRILEKGDI